jgi:hypothetical protein
MLYEPEAIGAIRAYAPEGLLILDSKNTQLESYSFSSSTPDRIMLHKITYFDYEDDLIRINAQSTISVLCLL